MAVVGSPDYFARHPAPATPRDLTGHNGISLRLPSSGGLYPWGFEKDGQQMNVRVDGLLVFSNGRMILEAASKVLGLGFIVDDQATENMADGRLRRVLTDGRPSFFGYHLYYPSRRQSSLAFSALQQNLIIGRHQVHVPC